VRVNASPPPGKPVFPFPNPSLAFVVTHLTLLCELFMASKAQHELWGFECVESPRRTHINKFPRLPIVLFSPRPVDWALPVKAWGNYYSGL